MSLLLGAHNINSAVTGSGIYVGTDGVVITFPREFVAGDSWGATVDGTLITTTFATTNEAMLDAILADFVAISGSVAGGKVLSYNDNPRIWVQGLLQGHELVFTLPTGTTDLKISTNITHSGVRELALLVANPFDVYPTTIIDSNTAGTVYTCYALAGSSASAPVWAIKKVVTAANVATTTWADGNTNNDNIAANRGSLTYS